MLRGQKNSKFISSPLCGLLLGLALSLGLPLSYGPLAEAQSNPSTRAAANSRTLPNRQNAHYQSYLQRHLNQPGRIERDHSVASFSGVVYSRLPASASDSAVEETDTSEPDIAAPSGAPSPTSSEEGVEP